MACDEDSSTPGDRPVDQRRRRDARARRHLFGDPVRNHGTLSLGTTTGLTFDGGRRHGRRHHDFHGTLADINNALATTSYAGDAAFIGSATVGISVTDPVGGAVATGTGAATSDSEAITVTVTAANDPVTASAPATASVRGPFDCDQRAVDQRTSMRRLRPTAVYGDAVFVHGALMLCTLTGLTFTASDGTADASMTFHGTLADINTALATASYAADADFNGSDTLGFHGDRHGRRRGGDRHGRRPATARPSISPSPRRTTR